MNLGRAVVNVAILDGRSIFLVVLTLFSSFSPPEVFSN